MVELGSLGSTSFVTSFEGLCRNFDWRAMSGRSTGLRMLRVILGGARLDRVRNDVEDYDSLRSRKSEIEKKESGAPKKTWRKQIDEDMVDMNGNPVATTNRMAWRSALLEGTLSHGMAWRSTLLEGTPEPQYGMEEHAVGRHP